MSDETVYRIYKPDAIMVSHLVQTPPSRLYTDYGPTEYDKSKKVTLFDTFCQNIEYGTNAREEE